MSSVAIVKCDCYEIEKAKEACRRAFEYLGGIDKFVKPGEKVLLKINLLIRRKPEKATTSHPIVVQALSELVKEAGANPIIGDSPGGYHFYNKRTLESVYDTCGIIEAAEKSGAELNYNTDVVDVEFPQGMITKNIKTIKPVLEVDKIINLCKVKTHMMTVYSGAVKNLFGIIPGSYKAEYHLRFENTDDFANLLIDLCQFAKPAVTIMDAVVGMEGYGPTNGSPRKIGLILASENPYELDVAAAAIIGLKPEQVPTIRMSKERGLCCGNLEDINILGEKIEDVLIHDFKIPTRQLSFNFLNLLMPRFLSKSLSRFLKPRPKFKYDKCKSCRMCEMSCPPSAITMKNGRPSLDYNKCIRCFCCHELCIYNAIEIKRPWYLKFLLK